MANMLRRRRFIVTCDDFVGVNRVFREKTDAVRIVFSGPTSFGGAFHITFELRGTVDHVEAQRKIIRRLSRGKPKFTVQWGFNETNADTILHS